MGPGVCEERCAGRNHPRQGEDHRLSTLSQRFPVQLVQRESPTYRLFRLIRSVGFRRGPIW